MGESERGGQDAGVDNAVTSVPHGKGIARAEGSGSDGGTAAGGAFTATATGQRHVVDISLVLR